MTLGADGVQKADVCEAMIVALDNAECELEVDLGPQNPFSCPSFRGSSGSSGMAGAACFG